MQIVDNMDIYILFKLVFFSKINFFHFSTLQYYIYAQSKNEFLFFFFDDDKKKGGAWSLCINLQTLFFTCKQKIYTHTLSILLLFFLHIRVNIARH